MKIVQRIRAAALGLIMAVGGLAVFHSSAGATNQSPTQSYCLAWGVLSGQIVASITPLLELGVGCGVQYGDLFTDGPLYNPAPGLSGLTLAVPANTYVQQGGKVVTQAANLTMTNNATNYVYLDCNDCSGTAYGVWDVTTSATPPHSYSVLMYQVLTSAGNITAYSPTYSSFGLASGYLQIFGQVGAANQATLSAENSSQLLITNPNSHTSIGGQPGTVISETNADCNDSSVNQYAIEQELNTNHVAIFTIGCSSSTSDVLQPAIHVNGNSVFSGPISTSSGGITDGSLTSASSIVLCGGNTTPYVQCPNAYLLSTNSTNSITDTAGLSSAPAWTFDETNAACMGIGAFATDAFFELQAVSTNLFSVLCNGKTTALGPIISGSGTPPGSAAAGDVVATNGNLWLGTSATNCEISESGGVSFTSGCGFKNSKLGASSGPVCGSSSAPETGTCIVTPATPASSGALQASTGATANTWVTATAMPVTTGVSNGPSGKWLLELEMFGSTGNNALAGETVSLCITSTGTFTAIDNSMQSTGTVCTGGPLNPVAGGPAFGMQSSSSSSNLGNSEFIRALVYVANSTSITFNCKVEGSTNTSATVNYYCHAIPIPI